jgi:hypothetical protein
MMLANTLPLPRQPEEVREMLHHASYYFPAERAGAFDRLRSGEAPIPFSELVEDSQERSLASCAAALAASGVRVALVDVTSPDVATGPFRVVRAVSPDLQPIYYGYGLERRPVERARVLGLAARLPPVHPIW